MNDSNAGKITKNTIVKIASTAALIMLAVWSFNSAPSMEYTGITTENKTDTGSINKKGMIYARYQQQLTKKLIEVSGVWVTVKTVSGIISLVKTIQIEGSVQFLGGAAVSIQPLGMVEAVDNTLDQISNMLLWAMGAIAIQKILLAVSLWVSVKIVVPICLLLIAAAIWCKKYKGQLTRFLLGIVIICAGICSAVPLSLELSNKVETSILDKQLNKLTKGDIEGQSFKDLENAGDLSFGDILKEGKKKLESFWDKIRGKIDKLITSVIDYIMCFVATRIIIPIGTIVGLWYLIGAILNLIGFSGGQRVAKDSPKKTNEPERSSE
jgi:hypothetical protein